MGEISLTEQSSFLFKAVFFIMYRNYLPKDEKVKLGNTDFLCIITIVDSAGGVRYNQKAAQSNS